MTSLGFPKDQIKSQYMRRITELESTSQLLSQTELGRDAEFLMVPQEWCHYITLRIKVGQRGSWKMKSQISTGQN